MEGTSMEINITATDIITEIDGVPVRVWRGVTDQGTPCDVFVHRVGAAAGENADVLARELREMPQPREFALTQAIGLRHIL